MKALEAMFEKDKEDIDEIHDYLRTGAQNQADIIKGTCLSQHRVVRLLRRYRSKQWEEEIRTNNAKFYRSYAPDRRSPRQTGGPL